MSKRKLMDIIGECAGLNDELLNVQVTQIQELLYLKKLNIDLLDTNKTVLTWVLGYCEKNNIPIWKEKSLRTIITMTQNILGEISKGTWTFADSTEQKLSDEKKHTDCNRRNVTDSGEFNGTDGEVPVPFQGFWCVFG